MINTSLLSSLVFLFDLLAAALAFGGALLLSSNLHWPPGYETRLIPTGLPLLAVHIVACRVAGLYRGMWVFASLPDLKRVLKAVAMTSAAMLLMLVLDHATPTLPRSMAVLFPILLLVIMSGGRATWRMWKEYRLYGGLVGAGKPVIIVGAGSGGAMLVRELERSPDWQVVALVDDDSSKWRRELYGHPVVGAIDLLPRVLEETKAQHVILAMPSAAGAEVKRATDLAVRAGAHVFTVPGLEDLMNGKVAIHTMRPVDIEDLLGREPVCIDSEHVSRMITGKTVLITGAGGSIGSELCRQLARYEPARLILLESSEFALYNIEQWFANMQQATDIVALSGDVKDPERIETVFKQWKPQIVFHAAAYKHVPLMEVGNAWEAVRNNVLGTLRVASSAHRHGVERFVLISTDKAVNPTNVMGATKRLAEMVCEALQRTTRSALETHETVTGTQFEIVRFGNVLGSTGSVIPKFSEQIARGGPVTVTHPDITRFFMSIPEAAQLVLQASAMGHGGEIFVLDMGKPVRIADLARNMIRLSGYTEDSIRIEFIGLRPGEKLYEELLADAEQTRTTPHPKLRIARSRPVPPGFIEELERWLSESGPSTDCDVRLALRRWVREYEPAVHP